MALTTPAFTAAESLAYNNLVLFTDVSVGTDLTLTNRRIYIRLANGNYLTAAGESTTEVYTDWPYANATIQLSLLSQSTSPEITVKWYAGASKEYEVTDTTTWNLYDYVFMLGILQNQTSAPGVLQDTNYYNSSIQFIVNLSNSENAVLYGDDIYSSQSSLNKNQNLINNQGFYF